MSGKEEIIERITKLLNEISNEYFLLRIENYVKCLKDKCSNENEGENYDKKK